MRVRDRDPMCKCNEALLRLLLQARCILLGVVVMPQKRTIDFHWLSGKCDELRECAIAPAPAHMPTLRFAQTM
jgi:hypothetical protein